MTFWLAMLDLLLNKLLNFLLQLFSLNFCQCKLIFKLTLISFEHLHEPPFLECEAFQVAIQIFVQNAILILVTEDLSVIKLHAHANHLLLDWRQT
jgi:hypothetical protein